MYDILFGNLLGWSGGRVAMDAQQLTLLQPLLQELLVKMRNREGYKLLTAGTPALRRSLREETEMEVDINPCLALLHCSEQWLLHHYPSFSFQISSLEPQCNPSGICGQ